MALVPLLRRAAVAAGCGHPVLSSEPTGPDGVDGSASSLRALDWAVDETARLDLPVKIVHGTMQADREPACGQATGAANPCGQDIGRHAVGVCSGAGSEAEPERRP